MSSLIIFDGVWEMTDQPTETSIDELIAKLVEDLRNGGVIRTEKPGNFSSSSYGYHVSLAVADRLSTPAIGTGEVKPLEWAIREHTIYPTYAAKSVAGMYHIVSKYITKETEFSVSIDGKHFAHSLNIEGAQAAAQADYEARIRSALVSPPVSDLRDVIEIIRDAHTKLLTNHARSTVAHILLDAMVKLQTEGKS